MPSALQRQCQFCEDQLLGAVGRQREPGVADGVQAAQMAKSYLDAELKKGRQE